MGTAYDRSEDEFEADFALGGEVELEEMDETDAGVELALLAERAQAARDAGV